MKANSTLFLSFLGIADLKNVYSYRRRNIATNRKAQLFTHFIWHYLEFYTDKRKNVRISKPLIYFHFSIIILFTFPLIMWNERDISLNLKKV